MAENTQGMTVLTGKEALQMVAVIYEINQDFKNAQDDSTYSLVKGKIIAFKTNPEDKIHVIGTPVFSKTRMPAQPYIHLLNGYVGGKDLFGFLKENKKFANEVHLGPDHFVIKTSVPEVEYSSMGFSANADKDHDPYREFVSRVIKPNRTKERLRVSRDITEMLKEIDDSPTPVVYSAKGFKIRLTHKLFLGMKAKSQCSLRIFEIESTDPVYLVQMSMKNPTFESENYFVILKY